MKRSIDTKAGKVFRGVVHLPVRDGQNACQSFPRNVCQGSFQCGKQGRTTIIGHFVCFDKAYIKRRLSGQLRFDVCDSLLTDLGAYSQVHAIAAIHQNDGNIFNGFAFFFSQCGIEQKRQQPGHHQRTIRRTRCPLPGGIGDENAAQDSQQKKPFAVEQRCCDKVPIHH